MGVISICFMAYRLQLDPAELALILKIAVFLIKGLKKPLIVFAPVALLLLLLRGLKKPLIVFAPVALLLLLLFRQP